MNDNHEHIQAAEAQENKTDQSAFPFSGDQLPDAAKSKTRSVSQPEVEAERSYFRHLGRDLVTGLLGREVPWEVATQYFEYRRNVSAAQTSAKRMGDLIGFGWSVLEYQQGRREASQDGQGELALLARAISLPRLSEKYPGLDLFHAEKLMADAIEAGLDSSLSLEDCEFLARLNRGRLGQQRQMVIGFAYDLLMKSYEQGIAAPAAKKAYSVFVAAVKATRSNVGLGILWAAFEQLYSTVDWFDYDRKGVTARSVLKNANRAAAHERERAEREALQPAAKPATQPTDNAALPSNAAYESVWDKLTGEEKARRDAEAEAELERMLNALNSEGDVLGRCQVRDPRVNEYFVVAFHRGYQTVDLVVDNHTRTGLTRLDSWVREIQAKDPQKVLVRDLKKRLEYVAEHPGAAISMRSVTGVALR